MTNDALKKIKWDYSTENSPEKAYNLHFSETDLNSQCQIGNRAKRGSTTVTTRVPKENETSKAKNVAFIIKQLDQLDEDQHPNEVYVKLSEQEDFDILFDWEDALKIYYKTKSIKKTVTNREVAKNFFDNEAYYFQKDLKVLVDTTEADSRKMIFVYETTGNTGKSRFKEMMYKLNPYTTLFLDGDISGKDLKYLSCKIMKRKLIILDVARGMSSSIPYNALEDVKSGNFNSSKYDTVLVTGDTYPHIIVLSNELPDLTKLSIDRYLIAEIIDYKLRWGVVCEYRGNRKVVFFKPEENDVTKLKDYETYYRNKYVDIMDVVNSPDLGITPIQDFQIDQTQINEILKSENLLKRKNNNYLNESLDLVSLTPLEQSNSEVVNDVLTFILNRVDF